MSALYQGIASSFLLATSLVFKIKYKKTIDFPHEFWKPDKVCPPPFREDSQINLINENAGRQPVKVDAEVFQLIERSLRISDLTDGYFDISYGGIDKTFWNFDREMKQLPNPAGVKDH